MEEAEQQVTAVRGMSTHTPLNQNLQLMPQTNRESSQWNKRQEQASRQAKSDSYNHLLIIVSSETHCIRCDQLQLTKLYSMTV